MRKYLLLVVFLLLFASCKGCELSDGQAPLVARWSSTQFPLHFLRSSVLPPELHRAADVATTFWNSKVGYIVFHPMVVDANAFELVDPPLGTVVFTPMPVGNPNASGFGWRWANEGRMHSLEFRVAANVKNPARVIAHELGHALGLGEGSDPKLLMNIEANPAEVDPAQWELGDKELQAIRNQVLGL